MHDFDLVQYGLSVLKHHIETQRRGLFAFDDPFHVLADRTERHIGAFEVQDHLQQRHMEFREYPASGFVPAQTGQQSFFLVIAQRGFRQSEMRRRFADGSICRMHGGGLRVRTFSVDTLILELKPWLKSSGSLKKIRDEIRGFAEASSEKKKI